MFLICLTWCNTSRILDPRSSPGLLSSKTDMDFSSSAKSYENNKQSGTFDKWWNAERAETVQFVEVSGVFYVCVKLEPDQSQWCTVTEQEPMLTNVNRRNSI